MSLSISRKAEDPRAGMTLGELFALWQDTDHLNIDPRTPVKVSIGWRGQIQVISAEGETE